MEENDELDGLEKLMEFEKLNQRQQLETAYIMSGVEEKHPSQGSSAHKSQFTIIPPNDRTRGMILKAYHNLHESLENNLIVVGIDYSGKVVAMYEMSPFRRIGNNLSNSEPGLMIAEPRGEGIADEFLTLLEPILETLACVAGSSHLTHVYATKETSLLIRHKYTDIGDNDKTGQHVYRRDYMPKNHPLGKDQQRIVDSFMKSVEPYVPVVSIPLTTYLPTKFAPV